MNQPDTCQLCEKDFAKQDRVVVCPHCGAPYHKVCYDKVGHCVYEAKHGQGFEYIPSGQTHTKTAAQQETAQPEKKSAPLGNDVQNQQNASSQQKGTLCQTCRTINARSNIFCERCGNPLHQAKQTATQKGSGVGEMPSFMRGFSFPPTQNIDMQGEFDGLSKRDWAAFIGQAAPSYFMRMSQQDMRKTKLSFSFSAFFFSYFYFAYRKMWVWAAIALSLEIALLVPDFLSMYMEAGVPFVQGLSLEFMNDLQMVFYVLGIIRNVGFGVFSLYLYRKDAAGKIRQLQQQHQNDQALPMLLSKKGGVSLPGLFGVLAVLFLVSTLWIMGGGDILMNHMMEMMNMPLP